MYKARLNDKVELSVESVIDTRSLNGSSFRDMLQISLPVDTDIAPYKSYVGQVVSSLVFEMDTAVHVKVGGEVAQGVQEVREIGEVQLPVVDAKTHYIVTEVRKIYAQYPSVVMMLTAIT